MTRTETTRTNPVALPGARAGTTLATVAVVQFMVSLDLSVVNVGLPQIGAALGFGALGTAAQHRTGPAATPEALNDGYALGLGLGAALLVAAALVAATVLRPTTTASTEEET
jgi:hypothetical protein